MSCNKMNPVKWKKVHLGGSLICLCCHHRHKILHPSVCVLEWMRFQCLLLFALSDGSSLCLLLSSVKIEKRSWNVYFFSSETFLPLTGFGISLPANAIQNFHDLPSILTFRWARATKELTHLGSATSFAKATQLRKEGRRKLQSKLPTLPSQCMREQRSWSTFRLFRVPEFASGLEMPARSFTTPREMPARNNVDEESYSIWSQNYGEECPWRAREDYSKMVGWRNSNVLCWHYYNVDNNTWSVWSDIITTLKKGFQFQNKYLLLHLHTLLIKYDTAS